MSDSRPEQLIRAEELYYNGKVDEALEIVENFEKISELTQKDQLSALLLKGNIFCVTHEFIKAIDIGEDVYPISQELGLVPESIEALSLKAQIFWFHNFIKFPFFWNKFLNRIVFGIIIRIYKEE